MRPLPYPDHLTGPYWTAAREGALSLPRCEDCGRAHFYPRPACLFCGAERIVWKPASGRGSVYSFSVVHRAPGPAFAADVPYVVAIIATEEGPHLLSRVVGIAPDKVRIGLRVKARFEAISDEVA